MKLRFAFASILLVSTAALAAGAGSIRGIARAQKQREQDRALQVNSVDNLMKLDDGLAIYYSLPCYAGVAEDDGVGNENFSWNDDWVNPTPFRWNHDFNATYEGDGDWNQADRLSDYTGVRSPSDGVIMLVDSEEEFDGGDFDAVADVSFIELPDDIIFVESVAHNENYKRGFAYVAVQHSTDTPGVVLTSVYEFQPGVSTTATLILANITTPNRGSTDISVWGSALSSDGIYYICAYNHNSIMAYNLTSPTDPEVAILQIEEVWAPKELALDPENENNIYVCGGSQEELIIPPTSKFAEFEGQVVNFTNPTNGNLFKIDVTSALSLLSGDGLDGTAEVSKVGAPEKPLVETVASDFGLLVGIQVQAGRVWISRLYDIISINTTDYTDEQIEWNGQNIVNTWWADNLDTFEDMILAPVWGPPLPFPVSIGLQQLCVQRAGQVYMQLSAMLDEGEDLTTALEDAELPVSLSYTFAKKELFGFGSNFKDAEPVRMAILDTKNHSKAYHFELHLEDANTKNPPYDVYDSDGNPQKRHYFNEQITHSARIPSASGDEGYVVSVNFETPRILVVNDRVFKDFMDSEY